MPWTSFVIPAVMATVGAGAIVTTVVAPAQVRTVGTSAVWIDGPSGETTLPPGNVPVTAHATADDAVTGLDLYVDKKLITNDKTLAGDQKLFYGGFTWKATVGTHYLVVKQVGGTGASSFRRKVIVAEGAPPATTPFVPTTTQGPPETTTTSGPQTTTTGPVDAGTTATVPEGSDPTPGPGPNPPGPATPGTSPPQPTAPVQPPQIATAELVSNFQNRLYVQGCAYSVQVKATITGADYAQVMVEGTAFNETMARSGNSYSLTLGSGPSAWGSGDTGVRNVTVVAGGGRASAERVIGTVDIRPTCPKD